jgi:hypothetical protein
MKKVLAILLTLSLLVQCTAQYAVIALYKVRKEYVATVLCENRSKPSMHCNGKCYLAKQLKKVTNGSATGNENSVPVEKETLVYLLPTPIEATCLYLNCNHLHHAGRYCGITAQLPGGGMFRPPNIV